MGERAAEWTARLRWWWAGDRVKVYRVAESRVMGGLQVRVLGTMVGLAGIFQLAGVKSSRLVSDWGGHALDVTWAITMILGAVLVWSARLLHHQADSAWLEAAGMLLLGATVAVYGGAVYRMNHWDGTLFVLALCASSVLGLAGRSVLLMRQLWLLRKVVGQ